MAHHPCRPLRSDRCFVGRQWVTYAFVADGYPFWKDRPKLRDVAACQSRTTHAAPEAVDACVVYAEIFAYAIEGRPRSAVLRTRLVGLAGKIEGIVAGSWRGKARQINASGYVTHSLEASLWAVVRSPAYGRAVLHSANLGQDADTTAAIAGQLAGAFGGASTISNKWLTKLAWRIG